MFFVEDRIAGMKRRTMAPTSQSTFGESDFTAILDEQMLLKLVSDITKIREEFFLAEKLVPIRANVARYPIPARAIGSAFQSLHLVDLAGNIAHDPLVRIDTTRKGEFVAGEAISKFYIEGDEVVIPKPAYSEGSLLFTYPRKPNRLVPTSRCAKIVAIEQVGDSTNFTVDTDLVNSLPANSLVDILSVKSPYLLWTEEAPVLAVSSNQIQVASALVANEAGEAEPKIGDYICPSGSANIPMIPEEFHPVLDQLGAVQLLQALGHLDKWQVAKAELKEVREEALVLIKNRVQASPKRMRRRNGLVQAFGR